MSFRARTLSVFLSMALIIVTVLTGATVSAPPAEAAPAGYTIEDLPLGGLTEPTSVEFASTGQVFVAERRGVIKAFDNLNSTTPRSSIDLRTRVFYGGDRGLLSIVLDPQYPTRPYLWALYTKDADVGGTPPKFGTGGDSDTCRSSEANDCRVSGELTRLTLNPSTGGWTGTETVLLNGWCQQYGSHSMGSLLFGADGFLYVSAGEGANYDVVDTGSAGSERCSDPERAGGALRSQSVRRAASTPAVLGGAVLRLDPDTGGPAPGNPFASSTDPIRQRVLAYGFRNPFRMAYREDLNQIWVGDVGWSTWEEIDRINLSTTNESRNYGWPCYEGAGRQSGYEAANAPLCNDLYSQGESAVTAPQVSYNHGSVLGGGCPSGSSSVSAMAWSTHYPNGNLFFFGDYSRHCLWVANTTGHSTTNTVDPTSIKVFDDSTFPAELKTGPSDDLYVVDIVAGKIKRIRYTASGNTPPIAVAKANPPSGPTPLTVQFDASGSSDPDAGSRLSYAWDLDGDGQFNDSTAITPTWTYRTPGQVTARLRVTDNLGAATVGTVVVTPGSTAPVITLNSAASTNPWKVGDPISFTASATDAEDGSIPASKITTKLAIKHCPGGANCHEHIQSTFTGGGATFIAPDHEYPSYLELQASVTDSSGITSNTALRLDPATVNLTIDTQPTGLQAVVAGTTGTTPFTVPVIQGSANTIAVKSPQVKDSTYAFASWSDGGAASHDVTANRSTSYTATFTETAGPAAIPGLVGSYAFDEGAGGTALDASAQQNPGTLEGGPTWVTAGKIRGALSFDGVDDRVSVPDIPALDLTNQVSLTAWVRPTAQRTWDQAVLKERPGGLSYALYASGRGGSRPNATISGGGTDSYVDSPGVLTTNEWAHLGMTYDGATMRLYVNGTEVASKAETRTMTTGNGPLRIGGNAIWGEWFQGQLDEVHVYNRAITAAEVGTDLSGQSGSGQDTQPPTTPTNLAATGGVNRVSLAWTASTDNAGTPTYEVHRSQVSGFNPGAPTRIASGLTSPNYVDANRPAGTFYYRVIASDGTNFSAASAQAAATVTGDTSAPTVPGNVKAAVSDTTAAVTWNASTDNIGVTDYQVVRGGPGGATTFVVNAPTTTLADSGLSAGTYTYKVRARDAAGNASDYSAAATATVVVDAAPPSVSITAPAAGTTVSGTVDLTANANDDVGVVGVQFLVDGTAVGAEDTAAPYTGSWASGAVANGTHQVTAVARDAAGKTATAAPVTVTVNNGPATPTGPAGLVAAWSFNETSGTTAADSSGLGNTGTLKSLVDSGPKWTTAGKYGGALTFDGTDDFVQVADANSLDLTSGMTLSAWVRPAELATWDSVVMKERSRGLAYSLYSTDSGKSRPNGTVNIGGRDITVGGPTALVAKTWVHLAVSYDGANLKLYVDGQLVKTQAQTGAMTTSDGVLRMGGNSIWGEWLKGELDEVRIYNRALTASEVETVRTTPI